MKNSSLPILAFLAVIAAAIFLPISAGVTSFALTMAGALAILAADYGRTVVPLRVPAEIIPFARAGRSPVSLGKAA